MDILKLKPIFKDYIWGGTRLKTDFGFKSDLDILAEGWMLSCHKDGMNTIDGGEFEIFLTSLFLSSLLTLRIIYQFRFTLTTNTQKELSTSSAKPKFGMLLTQRLTLSLFTVLRKKSARKSLKKQLKKTLYLTY